MVLARSSSLLWILTIMLVLLLDGLDAAIPEELLSNNDNYYEILGVSPTASEEVIKKRYRKLIIENHPDKNLNLSPDEIKIKEEKFRLVHDAYQTLSDPSSRKFYDIINDLRLREMQLAKGLQRFHLDLTLADLYVRSKAPFEIVNDDGDKMILERTPNLASLENSFMPRTNAVITTRLLQGHLCPNPALREFSMIPGSTSDVYMIPENLYVNPKKPGVHITKLPAELNPKGTETNLVLDASHIADCPKEILNQEIEKGDCFLFKGFGVYAFHYHLMDWGNGDLYVLVRK